MKKHGVVFPQYRPDRRSGGGGGAGLIEALVPLLPWLFVLYALGEWGWYILLCFGGMLAISVAVLFGISWIIGALVDGSSSKDVAEAQESTEEQQRAELP